jgi:hypothetical protein
VILSAPTGPPDNPATPDSPDTDSSAWTDTLTNLVGWLIDHPPVPIALALWAGALYGWQRLRRYLAQRGKPLAPLGDLTRRITRFATREDTAPLITKPAALAHRLQPVHGRHLYAVLAAAAPLGHLTDAWSPAPLLLALALTLWLRAGKVFRQRWQITMQMFQVAAAECRYPRGAELNPWAYIQIQNWHGKAPGTTAITFPAAYQSEDAKTREKFERQFNGTVSEEHAWTYKWESSKNRVICAPTPFLPTMAPYPGPGPEWDKFVLGVAGEGKQATWDCSVYPHALVCGPTGSGKSVLQRMILFHALAHSDTWKVVGVDPKMVEMGWLRKYPSVLKVALTLEDGVDVVQSVRDEMMRRYDEMSELGVNNFRNLDNRPPAILLMVDETFNFLSPEGIKSEEGKERDALHARAQALLGEIARLGRAAGIFGVFATQRPDATVIRGEFKNNLDCRIAAGRLDTTPSLMVLDDEAATRLPKIKGRGMIRLGGEMQTFQGYFAEQQWFDEFLAGHAPAGFDPGRPGGGLGARVQALLPGALVGRLRGFVVARQAAVEANEASIREGVHEAPARGDERRGPEDQGLPGLPGLPDEDADAADVEDLFGAPSDEPLDPMFVGLQHPVPAAPPPAAPAVHVPTHLPTAAPSQPVPVPVGPPVAPAAPLAAPASPALAPLRPVPPSGPLLRPVPPTPMGPAGTVPRGGGLPSVNPKDRAGAQAPQGLPVTRPDPSPPPT